MLARGAGTLDTCGASFCLVKVEGVTGDSCCWSILAQIASKVHHRIIIWQCKAELKKSN